MNDALFSLLGLPVTAHGLGAAIALSACAILLLVHFQKSGLGQRTGEVFLLMALPLCLLLARTAFVLARVYFFLERADGLAFRLYQGGYTIWGALPGFLLAGLLSARACGQKAARVLDAAAPLGLLSIALLRFLEGLSQQGYGQEVGLPFLRFFPFAVMNEYGEMRHAVFVLEGLAALLFALWCWRFRPRRPGDSTRLALILFCAFQLLFESFREDEYLSWGFVRVGQLFSALTLFFLLLGGLFARGHQGSHRAPRHLLVTGFALLILLIIAIEFALDKTTLPTLLLYAVMSGACLGLFAITRAAALQKEGGFS